MIDLDVFFSDSSRDVAMHFDLHLAGWRSETGRIITVPIQKYSMAIL